MYIKDINPIDKIGINLLNDQDFDRTIDRIIEEPLRKPCKIFRNKGIKTLMSSANKNNVLKQGEKRLEKEDLYSKDKICIPTPTFDQAGKGYAWIMIDFNALSDENKDLLFSLEERTDSNNTKVGEKGIWFVQPCEIGNITYALRTGQYDYDLLKQVLTEKEIPKSVEFDLRLAEFYKRHIILGYNWALYSLQSIILRMPINENTTLEEVEQYFCKLAEVLKNQKINDKENVDEER